MSSSISGSLSLTWVCFSLLNNFLRVFKVLEGLMILDKRVESRKQGASSLDQEVWLHKKSYQAKAHHQLVNIGCGVAEYLTTDLADTFPGYSHSKMISIYLALSCLPRREHDLAEGLGLLFKFLLLCSRSSASMSAMVSAVVL